MWSNGVALASKMSVKGSARLCRKLQHCSIPRCFSLATKVMHRYIWTSGRQRVDCTEPAGTTSTNQSIKNRSIQSILFGRTGNELCPVTAMLLYVVERGPSPGRSPSYSSKICGET